MRSGCFSIGGRAQTLLLVLSYVVAVVTMPEHNEAAHHLDRLRAEQIRALFDRVTLAVTVAGLSAIVLGWGLVRLDHLSARQATLWAAYILSGATAHLVLRKLYGDAQPEVHQWRPWAIWFTVISFAEGLGWGTIAVIGDNERFATEMMILVVSLNVAGAAIFAFGSYLPAFLVFFIPTTLPCLIWGVVFRNQFPEADLMLLLMMLFIVGVSGLSVLNNYEFKELVRLRIQTSVLADDLRKQKELAEQANIAKSRFLAAASHDLRQPVHALGLFVGALRGTRLPPEAIRFVDRIEQSTIALDSLFSAILDISRLDAGVVEVDVQTVAIQPLLNRICADYAAEAAQKSLALVQHRCGAAVRTDPVLLERILRNVVSNAVRHTERGRVVVGCRRRKGAVRVEVWDTGPGIALPDQERVFQEYFQLGNPERDRAKGLGLGLAIVRRLAGLLGCPVSLRSVPGRGSCFAVELPEAVAVSARSDTDHPAMAASGGLILVVDDEKAIREAMQALLMDWGYEVITAGSGAEMMANIVNCPVRPSAIICDYRLPGEENGIDVIRLLQSEYNEELPAMLITGDTAADRLIEAKASGLLLLHKPVPNAKLRAAIGSLTASSLPFGDKVEGG
jgi:signal transduction histidine kinase/ActR/RegA family two-component response regulator